MSCWLRKIPLWAPENEVGKSKSYLSTLKNNSDLSASQKRAPPPEYLVHTLSIAAPVWLPYHVWGVWTLRIRRRPGSDPSCSLPPPPSSILASVRWVLRSMSTCSGLCTRETYQLLQKTRLSAVLRHDIFLAPNWSLLVQIKCVFSGGMEINGKKNSRCRG